MPCISSRENIRWETIEAEYAKLFPSHKGITDAMLLDYFPYEWTTPGFISRFVGDPKHGYLANIETEVDFELLNRIISQEVSKKRY